MAGKAGPTRPSVARALETGPQLPPAPAPPAPPEPEPPEPEPVVRRAVRPGPAVPLAPPAMQPATAVTGSSLGEAVSSGASGRVRPSRTGRARHDGAPPMVGVPVGGVTTAGVGVGPGVRSRRRTGRASASGFGVGLGVGFGVGLGVGFGVGFGVGLGVGVGGTVTTTEPPASAAANLSLLRDRNVTACVPAGELAGPAVADALLPVGGRRPGHGVGRRPDLDLDEVGRRVVLAPVRDGRVKVFAVVPEPGETWGRAGAWVPGRRRPGARSPARRAARRPPIRSTGWCHAAPFAFRYARQPASTAGLEPGLVARMAVTRGGGQWYGGPGSRSRPAARCGPVRSGAVAGPYRPPRVTPVRPWCLATAAVTMRACS